MKRMSEVFVLPVDGSMLEVFGYKSAGGVTSLDKAIDADYCAAHAINHVDALADALEAVMHHYSDEIHGEVWRMANDALKAYRGEK